MNIDFDQIPFDGQNKKGGKRLVYLYAAILVLFSLLMFSWVLDSQRRVNDLYKQLNDKEQQFSKYRTKNGELVATQEQKILELTKENMALIKTANKFKAVQGQVQVHTNTIIQEVKVPYPVDVIKYIDTHTNDVYLRLPTIIERCDSFFSIYGAIGVDGLEIDSMSIPNELTITTGKVKGGFLKPDKYIVEVTSSNPYVDITKMKNTQFKAKRPVYKRWWFGFGLGAITTLILTR